MTEQGMGAAAPPGRGAKILLLLAVTVLLLAPALALLYRAGVLGLGTALGGVVVCAGAGALLVLAGMLVALLGWRGNRTADIAVAGLACCVALVPVAVVGSQVLAANQVPPIHDITTDPDNPPILVGADPEVPEASLSYPGGEVWEQQAAAYPDITSLVVDTDPGRTFTILRELVADRGWTVSLADPEDGHLEAVVTSTWFGFRDDIVVRVAAYPTGSLVDARSVSRVGQSDLGANARRIRALFDDLRARVSGQSR